MNAQPPLVSFVIPAYNIPAQLLRRCIESIAAQPLKRDEREIIVVDDGSDTPCSGMLSDLSAEVLVHRQDNAGLSIARNSGISLARGEYLQFVDADDCLTPSYGHCIDLLRQHRPDMLLFSFTFDEQPSNVIPTDHIEAESGAHYMSHHNIRGSACAYVFKRSLLGHLRFTPGIYHEDEEFTPMLMLRVKRLISTGATGYYYRRRPDSITTNTDSSKLAKRKTDIKQIIIRLQTVAQSLPPSQQSALQRRVAQLTMDYVYTLLVEKSSTAVLHQELDELRTNRLFPLPAHDYTTKYKWFRHATDNALGLWLLARLLPLMKKER